MPGVHGEFAKAKFQRHGHIHGGEPANDGNADGTCRSDSFTGAESNFEWGELVSGGQSEYDKRDAFVECARDGAGVWILREGIPAQHVAAGRKRGVFASGAVWDGEDQHAGSFSARREYVCVRDFGGDGSEREHRNESGEDEGAACGGFGGVAPVVIASGI